MKKIRILVAVFVCLMLVGCSNEFAKRQYDATDKIIQQSDHYTKSMSVMNHTGNRLTFTVQKFDGRQTVWRDRYRADSDADMDIRFTIRAGKAKLVHINAKDQVETLIECTADSGVTELTGFTIPMTKGENRLKVVGYDCEGIDLEIVEK